MMTIWEKAILNMQRGIKRISIAAALFADRVRVEINIVRLRIRIDEVQERIDAQHQAIGRKVVNLTRGEALPIMTEQLVKDEEITAAMAELTDCKQEIEELRNTIVDEQASMKTAQKQAEGTSE
jgi:predicted  nucleic acid-binding Zn-ribbon protein